MSDENIFTYLLRTTKSHLWRAENRSLNNDYNICVTLSNVVLLYSEFWIQWGVNIKSCLYTQLCRRWHFKIWSQFSYIDIVFLFGLFNMFDCIVKNVVVIDCSSLLHVRRALWSNRHWNYWTDFNLLYRQRWTDVGAYYLWYFLSHEDADEAASRS